MTQGTGNQNLPAVSEESFDEKARKILSTHEYNMLMKYIEDGKHALSQETALKFFELYLRGNSCGEIHRLNKAFPYESILWARVKYDWDRMKDESIRQLMSSIQEKVVQAQLETTSFMADLLTATSKKHGDKIKKFIQTGNEDDLGDALSVDSLFALLKVAEGLQKITGQDKVQKVKSEHTQTLNVNVTGSSGEKVSVVDEQSNYIDEQAAGEILQVMADAKRRKREQRSKG
jgi:hypothetical protein